MFWKHSSVSLTLFHKAFAAVITKKKLHCEMCELTVDEIYRAGTVPGLQVRRSHNTVTVFRDLEVYMAYMYII